jgi:aminopeptidase N
MIALLLLLQAAQPHDALHYDITLIPSDTSDHVLGEVQITWKLSSTKPVTMELDSSMRVIRVLVDGKPNTRLARTMYARSSTEIDVPHQKQAGDSISTRVRYRGYPKGGLISSRNAVGARSVRVENGPDRSHLWLPTPQSADQVTATFHIQVPLAYRVTTVGVLEKIDTLAYGQAMWHYNLERPVPVSTLTVGWVGGAPRKEARRGK